MLGEQGSDLSLVDFGEIPVPPVQRVEGLGDGERDDAVGLLLEAFHRLGRGDGQGEHQPRGTVSAHHTQRCAGGAAGGGAVVDDDDVPVGQPRQCPGPPVHFAAVGDLVPGFRDDVGEPVAGDPQPGQGSVVVADVSVFVDRA